MKTRTLSVVILILLGLFLYFRWLPVAKEKPASGENTKTQDAAATRTLAMAGSQGIAQPIVFSNAAPAAVPRRASIILVVAEGLGYGDLSCYGQTNYQTPNLDKLAAEGIRFTNYSANAYSAPQAELMLGKKVNPIFPALDTLIPLTSTETTIAQILKNSGYHTGWIGEWNLGNENSAGAPWSKGFDEFAGYLNASDAANFYADYMWRYAPKSILNETNGQMEKFMGRETLVPNLGGAKGEYIPDLLTKAALNFAKNNQPDKFNRFQPFFLVLNCPIPGDGKGQVPTDAPFSNEKWPQVVKNKAAMIARLDGYIGQLAEQLQKLGLTNNVAVFFTSPTVPDFGNGAKPNADLRVPMIVHWPGTIPAGAVSGYNWSAENFLPTAAEIGFAKPPADIKSTSILSVLTGRPQK